MDNPIEIIRKSINADWFVTAFVALVILLITAGVSHGLRKALAKLLTRDKSLLPASSIFLNVVRALVWLVGISFMLSTCFNVNVSAIITALGVGGIAITLGFQDTISNLIGGLQVSLSRIVKPGDRIKMVNPAATGIVRDVTWRHTALDDPDGNRVIIPNSIMNSTVVLKMPPVTQVTIPMVVTLASGERLTVVAHRMEDAAQKAVLRVSKLKKHPSITFTEITDFGYKGTLSFTITDADRVAAAKDAAIRAMAPYAHVNPLKRVEVAEVTAPNVGAENPQSKKKERKKAASEAVAQVSKGETSEGVSHAGSVELSHVTTDVNKAPEAGIAPSVAAIAVGVDLENQENADRPGVAARTYKSMRELSKKLFRRARRNSQKQ